MDNAALRRAAWIIAYSITASINGTKALAMVVESKGIDSGSQATKVKESFSQDKGTRKPHTVYALRQKDREFNR